MHGHNPRHSTTLNVKTKRQRGAQIRPVASPSPRRRPSQRLPAAPPRLRPQGYSSPGCHVCPKPAALARRICPQRWMPSVWQRPTAPPALLPNVLSVQSPPGRREGRMRAAGRRGSSHLSQLGCPCRRVSRHMTGRPPICGTPERHAGRVRGKPLVTMIITRWHTGDGRPVRL